MSLSLSQSIAAGGLANVSAQIAVVSQNITDAGTPGYAREIGTQADLTVGGQGFGVRTGPTTRQTDAALQAGLLEQTAAASDFQTRQAAFSALDGVLGAPGSGNDLGSQLGQLQDGFTALAHDPSNAAQQAAVAGAATGLAQGLNQLSAAYSDQRQSAQDSVVSGVAALNAALGGIGGLSAQIVSLKAQGLSTADLESQRDAAIGGLAQIVDVRVLPQSDGDVTLATSGGLILPTAPGAGPFSTAAANLGPGAYYPGGGVPAITLGGQDVTRQLTGGSLGANVSLRDATLPAAQAQLDEFSFTLAARFDAQGLTLFTRPDGTLPVAAGPRVQSGYLGFASEISVNPAVAGNPALVRDGTRDTVGPPAFTVNPPGGPSGFSTLVQNVLSYALGSESARGVPQPPPHVSGLGASGALSAGYAAPPDLATFASDFVSAEAAGSAGASNGFTQASGLKAALTATLSNTTGVSIDKELSNLTQLQNAYGANAKVLTAVQSLWTALFAAIA